MSDEMVLKKYIKLNNYKYNNINIFKLYLGTYSKKQTVTLNDIIENET